MGDKADGMMEPVRRDTKLARMQVDDVTGITRAMHSQTASERRVTSTRTPARPIQSCTALRKKTTHERFPTDGLNETIYDFGNKLSTNAGSPNRGWIAIHAGFPSSTLMCHRGDLVSLAVIVLVLSGANSDLLDDI